MEESIGDRPDDFSLIPGDVVEAKYEYSSVPGVRSTILTLNVGDIVRIARFNEPVKLDNLP